MYKSGNHCVDMRIHWKHFYHKSYQSTSSNTFKPPAVYSCFRCKYTKRSLLYS